MKISLRMKIGLFGGTFNPIHIGHMATANHVLHEFSLDLIHFIPAFQTAYKKFNPDKMHRKKMIQLALKDNKKFILNNIEFQNEKISHTYDTVKNLFDKKNRYFFILGDEWLNHFEKWHNYEGILQYAELIIVRRTNKKIIIPKSLSSYRPKLLFSHNPLIDISSSMIREIIKKGHDIRYLVPEKVYTYIKEHKLYR